MQRSAPKSLLGTLIMEALSSMKSRKCLPDFRPIEGLTHRSAFATDFSHRLFREVLLRAGGYWRGALKR